jgi:hypothetical protein
LSGRRKRRGSIISDERPIAFGEDGKPVDFRAIIAASKVMVLNGIIHTCLDQFERVLTK